MRIIRYVIPHLKNTGLFYVIQYKKSRKCDILCINVLIFEKYKTLLMFILEERGATNANIHM